MLFSRFVELLVPANGRALFMVQAYEAYFDESGTHEGSPIMCVAGYMFSAEQSKHFYQEWDAVLKEYGLPYFRMSECAHGTGVFGDKRERCDEIARRMIGIIKRRAERGIAACLSEKEFLEAIPHRFQSYSGGAYGLCIRWCFDIVADWVKKTGFEGPISYFFESGHKHQRLASHRIDGLLDLPETRESYRYAGHAFSAKEPTPMQPVAFLPLQAADLLAWQFRTFKRRKMQGKGPRLDWQSLLQLPRFAMDYGKQEILDYFKLHNIDLNADPASGNILISTAGKNEPTD
ncbi:MAG: DUF3800 domain-containing protein [Bryobacteraceae bacterium]